MPQPPGGSGAELGFEAPVAGVGMSRRADDRGARGAVAMSCARPRAVGLAGRECIAACRRAGPDTARRGECTRSQYRQSARLSYTAAQAADGTNHL
jgi:hypothetical protein